MFTGIVETTGTVLQKKGSNLRIERPASFDDLKIGSSVAVAGVCLSVVDLQPDSMAFNVVQETFDKTKLGDLKEGDSVNLERSLAASARFEGHIVQGHVEGVGEVVEAGTTLIVRIPAPLLPFLLPKGSIALDGVSLTIAKLEKDLCTIALIPHTLQVTTFGTLVPGDRLNIETDIMIRALWHWKGGVQL